MKRFGKRWALLAVMTLGLVASLYRPHADWYWFDLVLTRDQQGAWYFHRGDYVRAAQRFQRPDWKALAYYAAQDFQSAALLWEQIPGAEYHFNRANALAHMENYSAAADSYRLGLRLQQNWPEAQENLALVQALATKAEPFTGDRTNQGTKVGADDIVFDASKEDLQQSEQEATVEQGLGLSSAQINALWMRRLQSTPADFLRLKFSYQSQIEDSAEPGSAQRQERLQP